MISGNTQSIPPQSGDVSFQDLKQMMKGGAQYLRSKWKIIFLFGFIGGVLGFSYATYKKPVYTAKTTFVLEDDGPSGGLSSLAGMASLAGLDIETGGGGIFQGDNILELYKSRTMIQKTLLTEVDVDGKNQLLMDHYIEFNGLREKWAKKPKLKNITFNGPLTRLQDSLIGVAVIDINKNYLNVSKSENKSTIITAVVKAKNEVFAKIFNEQIVKNVNDFYIQTKTKKSLDNILILQQKTDSVRNVMNGAIYTAAAVSDATPNLNPTRQIQRSVPVQRSQFSVETNKAILSELIKNLELSKISLRKETPLIQVIDEPIYPLAKEKIGRILGLILGFTIFALLTGFVLILKRMF